MRLDAYFAASKISKEVILGGPTKTNYSSLSHQVPIVFEDIYQEGGKIKCIVYNLAHTLKPQLQQNLIKFLIHGLPTMDKISHFTLEPPTCWLYKKGKESWTHLLETCICAKSYLEKMGHSCIKLKLPSWESSSFVCGLTAQYCSNLFTSIVSAALLALWITVCAEGSQSVEYAIDIFHKVLKKNKLLSKPPRKDPTSAKKKREIEKFKFKGLQVFYDGSSHTDPHLGSAGYAIFRNGKKILAGAETIPFGTNNVGEFKGCLLGSKNARGLGSHIQIVGDCMILTKAAPKNCNISNHELNLLLIEIRATAARFEDAEFIHVFHKLNKHADAIATATSWSVIDGMAVVNNSKWNLHAKQVGKTEEEWIVDNSLLWTKLNNPLEHDWSYSIPSASLLRKFQGLVITTQVVYFLKPLSPDGTLITPVALSKDFHDVYSTSIPSNKLCESMLDNEKNRKKRKRHITFKEGRSPPSDDED